MKRFSAVCSLILGLTLICVMNAGAFSNMKGSGDMSMSGGDGGLSGTVVETMNSGGYTYVQIENDGQKTWVAVPRAEVSVGQEVTFAPGMVMNNFESKTLGRTFDAIVFSAGIAGGGGASSGHGFSGGSKDASSAAENVKVEKAAGDNAYTVAELYEKCGELHNSAIVVRGQVVKVSPAIMDKNWIHIQDGTGDSASGTNDIIVTSQELPSVGDVITATGTLYKDKDFGMGYKYKAIVEEATVEK